MLMLITKTCASYSKHTVQNYKRTRSFTKIVLNKIIKNAQLIQGTLQICKRTRSLLKVHCIKS